jgi:hypothetical protein
MKIFLLDLWQDLRDKRLAPVALVLAAALVVVPVVLSKPSESMAPAPAQTVRTAPDPKDLKELATVKLDDTQLERGSSLNTFDPGDPFRPPKKVMKKSQASDAPSTLSGNQTPDPTGSGSGGGLPSGLGGGSPTTTGGGDTGPIGGGGGGGDTGSKPAPTVQYRYVVDATFSVNGRRRKLKGLERLDMLPNEDSPLLLFLGVSANAGNAVFLVDSTLEAAGEGTCKPKPSECAFLYIGAGSEHAFTNQDGDSYELRIDEIRKVRVGDAGGSASRAKRASAAVGEPIEPRRFSSPLIADVVSSSGDSDSTANQNRR